MKLYTEEAIKAAIQIGLREKYIDDKDSDEFVDSVIRYFKSIELPTDEEIKNIVFHYIEPAKQKPEESDGYNEFDMVCSFNNGAKWVIEQIKKQK